MSGRLDGKVALVTGGAAGIGRAVTERFIAEGARVVVLDLAADGLADLRSSLGERVASVTGDVTVAGDYRRAVDTAVEMFGGLDVFVGNAGVFDGFARLEHLTAEQLEAAFGEIFRVNVLGYLLGARATAPLLRERGGCMVFTASAASSYPDNGGVLYTASKHAVVGLVRQLALELAPRIRVNAVAPGGTLTRIRVPPALRPVVGEGLPLDQKAARIAQRTPLRRPQRPEDHTGAYVLLASDDAPAMTGVVIESDGGLAVRGGADRETDGE